MRARVLGGALVAASVMSLTAFPSVSSASSGPSVISNGTVQLGVNPTAELNVYEGSTWSSGGTFPTGLRYVPTGAESTAPGCLCEGWGVAAAGTTVSGWANQAWGGAFNLDLESFDADGTVATSVVTVDDVFRVTHRYAPSASPNLYRVDVTIENTSASTVTPLYRRVMDWDIEPTAFSEFVTLQAGNAADLIFTSNDGFASADPLDGPSDLGFTGSFVDAGPADHGALFDFEFEPLAAGASHRFVTFYGGAGSEEEAVAALATVGAEAFSFGQPNTDGGPDAGTPNTFIFAFGEVGGDPIFCLEDGLAPLQPTPAAGVVSGTVHDVVEPAVASIDPSIAGQVHQVNCDVIVPLEDQVGAVLPPPGPASN